MNASLANHNYKHESTVAIQSYLDTPKDAVLPGTEMPMSLEQLRKAQISLCQHAPSVTAGIEKIHPWHLRWFEVTATFSFKDTAEISIGNFLPSYRQLIAHFHAINERLRVDYEVPDLFKRDNDIITAVHLRSSVEWLHVAVDDSFVSFTCLGPSTRKLFPGMALLFVM